MSINNIYCHTQVYKELYRKNENLHSNPDNLAFYLFKQKDNNLDYEVIKGLNLESIFGNIELAIIGSSHYFVLENCFMELLTCSTNKPDDTALYYSDKNKKLKYKKSFNDFTYSISIDTKKYVKAKDFIEFEKMLLKQKNIFAHAFDEKSAITALHYQNKHKKFLLQTWHTYPEHLKVVCSESILY